MESKLNNLAEKFTEKFKLDANLIISAGLVLNAFGIFELIQGNFVVFIVTIARLFLHRLVRESMYQRLAEWTKLFTVLAFFMEFMKNNQLIMIVAVIVLLLAIFIAEKLLIYHKDKESCKWKKDYGFSLIVK